MFNNISQYDSYNVHQLYTVQDVVENRGMPVYIYKVVISVCLPVCLFVCPIITQKIMYWFASNFDWELGRPTGMFLAWF